MFVKLTSDRARKGCAAGEFAELQDYEGRRLIAAGLAKAAVRDPLDHDGDGRKGGMKGSAPRRRRRTSIGE